MQSKVIVITGSSSGVGLTLANYFHDKGHQVYGLSRTAKGQEKFKHIATDVSDKENVKRSFQQIFSETNNQIDVLINNATVTKATPVLDITAADFDWVTQVNQRGTFQACQIIGKYMADKGYGRIVNMASLAGQNGGTATGAHYAATKGAIVTLTKIFAKEFAAKGVTVNAVAPGPMESPIVHSVVSDEKMVQFIQNIPVKALGSMEFIAETCGLLASPNAAFVTGATWDINGGLFMR